MNHFDHLSSDDEDEIRFVERLGAIRKPRRYQQRKDHMAYWDNEEFYKRFRFSKQAVMFILEHVQEDIKSPTKWYLINIKNVNKILNIKF